MKKTGKNENAEMPVGEWFIRLTCKFLALSPVILGMGGCAIICLRLGLPLIGEGNYIGAACVAIALVAAMEFGLAPMAMEIDKMLLRLCGGMQPLPRLEKKEGSGTD